MSQHHILALINLAEATFPVHTWTIDGVQVWPLIRIRLANRMATIHQGLPGERSVGKYAATAVKDLEGYAKARWGDRRAEDTLNRPVDALFLSDGVSFVKLSAGWYERFCDPLIDALRESGHTTGLMTPLSRHFTPRRTPSALIQPALDARRLLTLVESRLGARPEVVMPGREELVRFLEEREAPTAPLAVGPLARQVRLIRHYARYFEGVLARTRPAVGLQVSYYGNIGMAFNLACRARGILSVDLQHGIQGELHPAYGRWGRVPEDGYALLPTLFWTWTAQEAAVIEAWSAPVSDHHRPVVGGNLLLTRWAELDPQAVAAHQARIKAIQAAHPGAAHLLVTLHGLETPEELDTLADTLAAGEAGWFWWLRCHPARPEQARALQALLGARGLVRTEVAAATAVPLYSLLPCMDLHLTACSSSVIEAEQLGLPSIVTTTYGAELFALQLAAGTAVFAESPAAIAEAVRSQLGRHLHESRQGGEEGLAVLRALIAARRA
jgi:hypothetical protein